MQNSGVPCRTPCQGRGVHQGFLCWGRTHPPGAEPELTQNTENRNAKPSPAAARVNPAVPQGSVTSINTFQPSLCQQRVLQELPGCSCRHISPDKISPPGPVSAAARAPRPCWISQEQNTGRFHSQSLSPAKGRSCE